MPFLHAAAADAGCMTETRLDLHARIRRKTHMRNNMPLFGALPSNASAQSTSTHSEVKPTTMRNFLTSPKGSSYTDFSSASGTGGGSPTGAAAVAALPRFNHLGGAWTIDVQCVRVAWGRAAAASNLGNQTSTRTGNFTCLAGARVCRILRLRCRLHFRGGEGSSAAQTAPS